MNTVLQQAIDAHQGGELETAKPLYRNVLATAPKNPVALYGLGTILAQQGRPKKAYNYLKSAAALSPENPEVLSNYGNICLEIGKLKDAANSFQAALQIDPNIAEALNGLGRIFEKQKHAEASFEHYRKAMALRPGFDMFAESTKRVCLLLCDLAEAAGDWAKSQDLANTGLDLFPDDTDFLLRKSKSLMVRGRILDGRRYVPDTNFDLTKLPIPEWDGNPGVLKDGNLLVRAEQGVGDQLIFATTIPELKKDTHRLTVECDHRFVELFKRSFPGVEFVGWREPPVEQLNETAFAAQIFMLDACALKRPNLESFPDPQPFLIADAARKKTFRERFQSDDAGPIIGISWASAKTPAADEKTIPLVEVLRKFSLQNARFISLQYGDYNEEIRRAEKKCGVEVFQDPELDPLADLDGFSAAVAACDFVVSSSSATVHFAGALGVQTWAVIPANVYWHWFLDRADSPWYSSVNLVRRSPKDSNWKPALDRARLLVNEWLDTD